MANKNLNEMSVVELKAMLFDIDNEIKQKQKIYNQVANYLQQRLNEDNKEENNDGTNE